MSVRPSSMRTRHRSSVGRAALAVLALGLGSTLTACAHVAPYERGELSRRTMDVGEYERHENAFNAHVHDSREGATGGATSTGGGCGCN